MLSPFPVDCNSSLLALPVTLLLLLIIITILHSSYFPLCRWRNHFEKTNWRCYSNALHSSNVFHCILNKIQIPKRTFRIWALPISSTSFLVSMPCAQQACSARAFFQFLGQGNASLSDLRVSSHVVYLPESLWLLYHSPSPTPSNLH